VRIVPAGMAERWVYACEIAVFGRRQIVAAELEERQLILVRDGDGFFAAERACPHEGADLAQGRCSDGKLLCPRHLAWFDLRDGAVSPGWSFRALRVYRVRADGDALWIDLGPKGAID